MSVFSKIFIYSSLLLIIQSFSNYGVFTFPSPPPNVDGQPSHTSETVFVPVANDPSIMVASFDLTGLPTDSNGEQYIFPETKTPFPNTDGLGNVVPLEAITDQPTVFDSKYYQPFTTAQLRNKMIELYKAKEKVNADIKSLDSAMTMIKGLPVDDQNIVMGLDYFKYKIKVLNDHNEKNLDKQIEALAEELLTKEMKEMERDKMEYDPETMGEVHPTVIETTPEVKVDGTFSGTSFQMVVDTIPSPK